MGVNEERFYWNQAAADPHLDTRYICDLPTPLFQEPLASLKGRVLEIGCGVGRLMKPGFHGIDISDELLIIAMQRRPDCEFVVSDGRSIPYGEDSFDSVYSVLVFQHLSLKTVLNYIKEVKRVLKRGGVFIFQFIEGTEDAPFSKHHNFDKIASALLPEFRFIVRKGLIHPSWTWVEATKKEHF
jgi:ubiquinone/menaquinone biosynthesis C-methylase UbiE